MKNTDFDLCERQYAVFSFLIEKCGYDDASDAFFFAEEQRGGQLRKCLLTESSSTLISLVESLLKEKAEEAERLRAVVTPKKTPKSHTSPQGGKRARLAA